MSIRLMTRIWDSGAYSGGTLLVLLALADWANDEGERIFPHLETLAAKARLSVKQCRRVLEALLTDKVLEDLGGQGIKAGEMLNFRLRLDRLSGEGQNVPEGHHVSNEGQNVPEAGTPCPDEGTKCPAYIDKPSTEPSREPSTEPPAAAPPPVTGDVLLFPDLEKPRPKPKKHIDPSELDAAYAAYQAVADAAGWPRVSMRTPARNSALTKRLLEAGGIEGWRAALEKAAASDFCCGRCPPTPPRTNPFRADFDFFTQQSGFVKLMEGKYDNREGPSIGVQDGTGFFAAAARVAAGRASGGSG